MNDDIEKYLANFTVKDSAPNLRNKVLSGAKTAWEENRERFLSYRYMVLLKVYSSFLLIMFTAAFCLISYENNLTNQYLSPPAIVHNDAIDEAVKFRADLGVDENYGRIIALLDDRQKINISRILEREKEIMKLIKEGEKS